MRKIKNYEQYQINEDDSSGNIIHKIYGMRHEFKPTDGIHESELNLIHEKSKDAMWAIPNINFLDDPPTELASRMHGIIMYLICDELLRNPDELEDINLWKDVVWFIDERLKTVNVDLLKQKASPTYNDSIKIMSFTFEQLEHPLSYKTIKRFDL